MRLKFKALLVLAGLLNMAPLSAANLSESCLGIERIEEPGASSILSNEVGTCVGVTMDFEGKFERTFTPSMTKDLCEDMKTSFGYSSVEWARGLSIEEVQRSYSACVGFPCRKDPHTETSEVFCEVRISCKCSLDNLCIPSHP